MISRTFHLVSSAFICFSLAAGFRAPLPASLTLSRDHQGADSPTEEQTLVHTGA